MCLILALEAVGTALGASTSSAALVGGLTVAQTTLGAYSAYQSSAGARSAAKYQSKVDVNNATLATYAAKEADRIGFDEAQKQFRANAALRSQQVVGAAASGVDVSSGSARDIVSATDYFGRIDAETIRNNGAKSAWGNRMQALDYSSSSNAYLAQARANNPTFSVGMSLLSGGGNIADKWISRKIK